MPPETISVSCIFRHTRYSPDLNPIEQVWGAIKREVSATFVTGYEHMTATITQAFEKLAAKRTYWEKWVKIFLRPKYASKRLSRYVERYGRVTRATPR